jgi:hypothetical protein
MTDQPKEYYEKKPGFVIKSGTKDAAGKKTDFAIFTDNAQGFQYTADGNKLDHCNKTSYEVSGTDCKNNEPAKVIRAKNGDIIIEALNGDIILRGMNIRIEAKDGVGEVTISSPKQIAMNSPITNVKSTNVNMVASNNFSVGAQAVDTNGNVQNTQSTGTEEAQASILGKLLSIIKKFKNFI